MVKDPPANARDMGSMPGGEETLEEEMATPSSILAWRIPMGRGTWQAIVHAVSEVNGKIRHYRDVNYMSVSFCQNCTFNIHVFQCM